MEFLSYTWNNWLILAFVAPALWALVNLIDVYFVKEVYEDEYDGAIISGFFQIAPWILVPFIGFSMPDISVAILALIGGLLFCASMLFYFKAIFSTSDVSLIQVFWNLVALVVPILAFFILKEKLSNLQYLGILVTFAGATLLSFNKNIRRNNFRKFLLVISGAIIFLSLSMVVQDEVYSETAFFNGLLFFSLGYFLGSIVILNMRKNKSAGHLFKISKKYFFWFFLIESINLAAIICSQRTIDISPSVSFVALIESFVPAFVLILSLVIFVIFSILSLKKKDVIEEIHRDQIVGLMPKIIAIIIMAFGIYLINV